ncbi:MAG TPA: hypothetical protein DD458_18680 [Prolixibacteraceae bacterium]|nr:hypothetical protein [Prolixibacteraceae bacterium]HCR90635.1 hypothetical protein [Prolixibacteraceae bacterium]HCU60380.1 hypothetical protein [Prolixibacteraceae bacterium]
MTIIKVILLAIVLVTLALFGLAISILLKKGGQFPNTHIGGNKYLKQKGVSCAQTFDKMEQAKAKKELQFKKMKLASDQK